MTQSKRQFHRTVIQVEVLSEEAYSEENLEQIVYDIVQGECSGMTSIVEQQVVDGKTMADLLSKQGSDPGFFNLTEEGEDADEDD